MRFAEPSQAILGYVDARILALEAPLDEGSAWSEDQAVAEAMLI